MAGERTARRRPPLTPRARFPPGAAFVGPGPSLRAPWRRRARRARRRPGTAESAATWRTRWDQRQSRFRSGSRTPARPPKVEAHYAAEIVRAVLTWISLGREAVPRG